MTDEKKVLCFISRKTMFVTITACYLVFFCTAAFAITVTELGVGSARNDNEARNVEELRARAIRNVLEVAVIRVSGVILSGEQKDSLRQKDSYESNGNKIKEKLKQDSVFHNVIVSRTNAYAQLVEILKEWQEDGQYYVKARVDVSEKGLQKKLYNAGIFWSRVGNPTIHMSLILLVNNKKITGDTYTLSFLRDTMARNGISIVTNRQDASYAIPVKLSFSTTHVRQYNTFKTNCSISYEIIDDGVDNSIAAARKTAGPVAGFTPGETQSKCEKEIIPILARDLVKRLAREMNEIWNNGRKYKVTISNVDGKDVLRTANIIRNIFRVTNLSNLRYKQGIMLMDVQYKGLPFEFVDNLVTTFEYEYQELSLLSLEENVVKMQLSKLK